jgi:SCY1-like protein 2
MFSSALKSISSTNITANYSISPTLTSTAGPWKIYDCKKKSTGKAYSVFVFDRKSLESQGNSLGRSGGSSFKKTAEEVVERLKKEASSLAKLRHPSILELVEPVEETRGGGLQFVTESVTASLASALQEKDDQERSGGPGGRSSRYVTEDSDGVRRRRELEIDELEIQKGLLQISKALEFLHENAGLVHGNLTPDAVLINAKACNRWPGLTRRRCLLTTWETVRLENKWSGFLQSCRRVYEANIDTGHQSIRSLEYGPEITSIRTVESGLHFPRLRPRQQPNVIGRHVLSWAPLYRPL